MLRLALLLEILAAVVCIHCIYGRKIKFNIVTVVFCLVSVIILDIINTLEMSGVSTLVIYILFFAYCLIEFKQSVRLTIFKEWLFVIIFSAFQFMCLLLGEIVIRDSEIVRTVVCNVIVLLICVFLLPKLRVNELFEGARIKNIVLTFIIGFAIIVSISLLIQNKVYEGVQVEIFVFAIPAILLTLFCLIRWCMIRNTVLQLEHQADINRTIQDKYIELLKKVKLRQHEFKNHVATLFSMHYSYYTYEQLVQAQKEYSAKIQYENRYNNLLMLENGFLCGFLYGKFQEIEEKGVKIDYKTCVSIKDCVLPAYNLIEMLGILLDNAAEALKDAEDKRVRFLVEESKEAYQFTVCNPYRYVSYAEIESWFQMGVSEKGAERGIGLYHLKELCVEWKCRITCQNIDSDEKNWIKFILEIDKEGHCIE